jgi:hypothetical protein
MTLAARPSAPSERVPFTPGNLAAVPASPGVYLLYRHHRLIYIGLAAAGGSIREDLRHHLRGAGGTCTRAATEFDYEISQDPVSLYRHYAAVYLDTTGGLLPECNEQDGR